MICEWYGQSAFRLEADGQSVVIDPFGAEIAETAASRGWEFEYPPIGSVTADLVLVTHEHFDHNGVEVVEGDPEIIRARAGTHESPIGEVVGVAAEHDPEAGTKRGPNTIFVFSLGGVRVCHFGDFGQSSLRDEQAAAIGQVDLLFIPVGAGPTIDAAEAAAVVERLSPRWVVPMHYRTPRVGFLEPADAFLDRMPAVERVATPVFDTEALPTENAPLAVVPAVP
jgi:L-ascorbate metabolism protein UlaG (beta-lactamase superfamily)